MLSASEKLKDAELIKEILKTGRKIRAEHLFIAAKKIEPDQTKAAVVVSKKVSQTAVARNRTRRVIFNTLSKTKLSWQGHAMVIMVTDIDNEKELLLDLETCLNKL